MHNTTGDVALTNIGRKTNYLQIISTILCIIQNESSPSFLFPMHVILFLHFEYFQPDVLTKRAPIKEKSVD